ncbi:MAG: hypothetical protein IT384_22310 [Deltaproteobacteria bacterium]|nr:hypothetical protein [Deltaproteobacteria bacterium]
MERPAGKLRSAAARLGALAFLAPVVLALAPVTLVACGGGGGTPDAGTTDGGFDDHTLPRLTSRADFDALAAGSSGSGLRSAKITITAFSEPAARGAVYMSGAFYTLHDQWYWFRLMNGEPIPGDDVEPVRGFHFATIDLIVAYARQLKQQGKVLPLDLRFVGVDAERLYSPRFYRLAINEDPRRFGLASLINVPARAAPEPRPEIWAFELEYSDPVDHAKLVTFFETIEATTPAEIAGELKWLVRSPAQEALAETMIAGQLRYWDRIIHYRDLVTPGTAEVYSPGLTAGRLRAVAPGEPLEGGSNTDILVLADVPDFLPPCAGLITAVPQTPLAHVNVLARNRGIPNAHLAGVLDDPDIDQLARARAPVVFLAESPDRVRLVGITEAEYSQYLSLGSKPPLSVSPIDLTGVPATYPLGDLLFSEIDRLRPQIGGKSAGFLALLSEPGLDHPDHPVAITIKPYIEHLAPLRPQIEAMLRETDFVVSAKARFLVLEGPDDFVKRFTTAEDLAFKDQFLARPAGDVLGDLARGGGLKTVLRNRPMAAATLAEITASLRVAFADFASSQALRFRSSSNVEDIEGFNGAGLYDSNSGFLDAAQQPDPIDQTKTVEWAIKKTWSSYWGFEAFEERRLENVEHLSGSMGVTVHARFDDAQELGNGVVTYTRLPPNLAVEAIFELNVQAGSLSVTNPPPGSNALPEVDRLVLDRGAAMPRIERVRAASVVPAGTWLLDDAELLAMFEQTRSMTDRWLAQSNLRFPAARRSRTLTLDFEFRRMAAGWPALKAGTPFPERLIMKQARPLEPSVRREDGLERFPIPRDVQVRTRRAERRVCTAPAFTLRVIEAYTDPSLGPDLGHARAPFSAGIALELTQDVPELGFTAGSTITVDHLSFSADHPGMDGGGPWTLTATLAPAAAQQHGLDLIRADAAGNLRLARGAASASASGSCRFDLLFASPKDFLLGLLEAHAAAASGG